jgi:transposase InsO family protein
MHKHTKLTPRVRKSIYQQWCEQKVSFRSLGKKYHVDKNVIRTVIERGRLNDFSVHDSTNNRYRTIEYGLKKLSQTEEKVRKKMEKQAHRYEKNIPGEMVHGDTKRLPYIDSETKGTKREVLFILIDDCTRYLVADILPDKTQWSAAIFLKVSLDRLPFSMECHYSDNGKEYRGTDEHAFVDTCYDLGIEQRFTKVKHPWTNGKAERVIRTLLSEWFRKNRFTSREERRQSLYQFVDWYNHHRPHQGINRQTPVEKLTALLQGGDNA